jgi:hypothetical protein
MLTSILISALVLPGCSMVEKPSQPPQANNQRTPTNQPSQSGPQQLAAPGELSVGQANGSCTARGETVELRYAYAGRGQRFGQESVIILLTDQPIPPEAVAEEIKSQTMFDDKKIRGLEYVVSADGQWVRYHPSQYQESSTMTLKNYSIENEIVRGSDDEKSELPGGGKYSRSVKFVAAIVKGS